VGNGLDGNASNVLRLVFGRTFKIHSVPHREHNSVSVIKPSRLMLYREIIAVCFEVHTKHINTAVWAERSFFI